MEEPADETELTGPPFYRVEFAIMLAANDIRRTFDLVFSEFKLNLSEVALLALINEHGLLNQSALAKSLGMGKASLGRLVEGLEKRNLVQRQADPKDRRVWLIDLTEEGRKLSIELGDKDQSLREIFRAGVGREERQKLAGILDRFRINLRKVEKEIQEKNQ